MMNVDLATYITNKQTNFEYKSNIGGNTADDDESSHKGQSPSPTAW